MKTSILIIVLAFSVSVCAQWVTQYPANENNDLNDIVFLDAQVGYAVGNEGTILKTENGGAHWTRQASNTFSNLKNVDFISPDEGWVIGESVILKTSDGGTTWNIIISGSSMGLSLISFTDAMNGWVAGPTRSSGSWGWSYSYDELMRTTDGGQTWRPAENTRDYSSNSIESICFTDAQNGWIISVYCTDYGCTGNIYFTSDGGQTQIIQLSTTVLNGIFMLNRESGWAYGHDKLYMTADGGTNWVLGSYGNVDNTLNDIFFADPANGWMVGNDGTVIHSSDGGTTWEIQYSNSELDLNATYFISPQEGWVAGQHGVILHTTDGGLTWDHQTQEGVYIDLKAVHFINPENGWACSNSYYGTSIILTTSDGGDNWNVIHSDSLSYEDIFFIDEYSGWVVGENSGQGFILHTSDGGNTWEQQLLASRELNSLFFTDGVTGWASGPFIFNTQDGGEQWNYQPAPGNGSGIYFTDAYNGWAAGVSGSLLHTQDGGLNWEAENVGFLYDFNDVFFTDPDHGWVVGDYGTALKTSDGGSSWEVILPGNNYYNCFWSVCFADSLTGWISGDYGNILHTSDGGVSWENQESNTAFSLFDIFFLDQNNGWAVGEAGTILHTNSGGMTEIQETFYPSQQINIQTYPNPSGGISHFTFRISQYQYVILNIYDLQGREIATIIDKKLPAGDHKITWYAEGLPPGIYYYRIQAGNLIGTGKMILIK